MTMKKHLLVALVALTALSLSASSASAHLFGRGSHGSWGGGSRGSYGGSYGSYGGSWGGGSGGSWGGSRGSYGGSYGGSWGGSYGGSYGGYSVSSSSCGSCGGCSSCGGGYSAISYGDDYAVVGRTTTVVAKAAPTVKTQLTLTVPAEAKVTLAGVETKQTGEVRTFATTKLASGEVWNDYKVVIEMNRDGKTVREERVISLVGGQNQDLAMNFDSNQSEQIAQLSSK